MSFPPFIALLFVLLELVSGFAAFIILAARGRRRTQQSANVSEADRT